MRRVIRQKSEISTEKNKVVGLSFPLVGSERLSAETRIENLSVVIRRIPNPESFRENDGKKQMTTA